MKSSGNSQGIDSYRSILKGLSLFGSVQLWQVAVNLVRGKLVAVFLGPAGMGVSQLFMSSSMTLQRFASLGLNLAIVKEVASRHENGGDVHEALAVARRLMTGTALFGVLVCVLFSGWLSSFTFGSGRWTGMFMLMGLAVGFGILSGGLLALLQGLREVGRISKASLVSGLTGLVAGVPLYWKFGEQGIVPAMVLLSAVMAGFYGLALRKALKKLPGRSVSFVWGRHRPLVMRILGLGMVLMASDLIGSGCNYLLNVFLKYLGGEATVGLYQGANSLTNQYAGMVFAALALDYYPRLAAVASDNGAVRRLVNRQVEVVAHVMAPVAALLILSAPLVVRLLLTPKFECIVPLIRWMGLGVLLKGLMFPLGYIAFAKDNRRVFLWLEGIVGNLLTLTMSAGGYCLFGFEGLGYGMVADCAVCFMLYYAVNRRLYAFRFEGKALRASAWALAAGTAVFGASFIPSAAVSYSAMGAVCAVSSAVCAVGLRRLLHKDRTVSPHDCADGA